MIAFYSDGTKQVKAYDHGSDWQLIDGKNERWFSTWSNDKRASLHSAFSRFLGHDVNPNQIHGLKDIKP
jgi:hypothetical protein